MVSFEVFRRAVRDDLERRDESSVLGEPSRGFGREGVAVVDATSLRHLRFRAVYMLGVAERAWPPPPRPDPLLLEHERARLNDAGPGRVPMRTTPDEEPLTFWLGVQAAGEHLRLSYARSDSGGSGKHLPSYFFRAVAEALTGRRLTLAELDASEHVHRVEAGRLAHEDLAASLSSAEYDRGLMRAAVAANDAAPIEALRLDSEGSRGRCGRADARWSAALTPYDGVMTGGEALARAAETQFGRAKAVSASRLEKYALCPYHYFVRYALGVDAVQEPEETEQIDALERGSLIHAILERFLAEIGRDDPPRPEARERHLEKLRAVAAEEGREREARGVTGRPLIWTMDQRQIEEDLVRWYAAEIAYAAGTALRPGAFEVAFGLDGEGALSTPEPVAIRAGGRELLLQGRIDRIDWDDARTAFRVIDYKTGKTRPKESAVFDAGTGAAAAAVPARGGGDARHGRGGRGGAVLLREQRGRVPAEGDRGRAGGAAARRTGADPRDDRGWRRRRVLRAEPGRQERPNCRWCDLKDVCDANIERIANRKSGDERGAAYVALGDIV